MPKSMVLVATRKGLFVIESDNRKDWTTRGPFCESWPLYHAIYDQDSGTIFAAAASEWLGSSVWRSPDLGETWEQSSEGLTYGDDSDLKLNKISSLSAGHGRLFVGAESCGIFGSTDGGKTFGLISTLDGQPAATSGTTTRTSPPGISASRRRCRTRTTRTAGGRSSRGTHCSRRPTTRRRGRRATRACAPTGRSRTPRSATASTASSARRSTATGCISRTTSACIAATTAASRGPRSPRPAGRIRVRRGRAPARQGHLLHRPARPRPRAHDARRPRRGMAHAGRGLELAAAGRGPAARGRVPRVLRAGMAIDREDTPGLYFGTSTGQVYASVDEGESWKEIASYLPSISSVEVAVV